MTDEEYQRLVTLYLEDAVDDEELRLLSEELIRSEARVLQFNDIRLLSGLIHEHGRDAGSHSEPSRPATERTYQTPASFQKAKLFAWLAASVALVLALAPYALQERPVAMLVSSENAGWESSLPTTPGSRLDAGLLQLKTGIATIRFRSGVGVILEAPAKLQLIDTMRGKMLSGKATIDVPEQAIGFVMETPDGYVIDHGTQFSMSVDEAEHSSSFEVIEGEISVHVPSGTDNAMLSGEGQSAKILDGMIIESESFEPQELEAKNSKTIRIGVGNRAGTAIRNDRREFVSSRYLTVNRLNNQRWDRRSFFAFDISAVDFESVKSVTLQLNLVPFRQGYFSNLPLQSRYEVYGLTNAEKSNWETECLWKDSPGPEDGTFVGSFEVPRSQQRGNYSIQNKSLLQFLKSNELKDATFILVRTSLPGGRGNTPSHAFAGVDHREANAPYLEFSLTD